MSEYLEKKKDSRVRMLQIKRDFNFKETHENKICRKPTWKFYSHLGWLICETFPAPQLWLSIPTASLNFIEFILNPSSVTPRNCCWNSISRCLGLQSWGGGCQCGSIHLAQHQGPWWCCSGCASTSTTKPIFKGLNLWSGLTIHYAK